MKKILSVSKLADVSVAQWKLLHRLFKECDIEGLEAFSWDKASWLEDITSIKAAYGRNDELRFLVFAFNGNSEVDLAKYPDRFPLEGDETDLSFNPVGCTLLDFDGDDIRVISDPIPVNLITVSG